MTKGCWNQHHVYHTPQFSSQGRCYRSFPRGFKVNIMGLSGKRMSSKVLCTSTWRCFSTLKFSSICNTQDKACVSSAQRSSKAQNMVKIFNWGIPHGWGRFASLPQLFAVLDTDGARSRSPGSWSTASQSSASGKADTAPGEKTLWGLDPWHTGLTAPESKQRWIKTEKVEKCLFNNAQMLKC